MGLDIYFVDWCGQKGPQIAMLKLVLCLFSMFFILLMTLIPSENILHVSIFGFDGRNQALFLFIYYSNRILNHFPVLAHGLALEMRAIHIN